ncbi:MAG: DpnI domain-containing protein [Candidatus Omnitrophota bacterium]
MSLSLKFDIKLAEQYKNSSQKVRVLTEGWVKNEAYCPSCGNTCLEQYSNNTPVADFFCENCSEDFELKSKSNGLGKKIVDGAYWTMIDRLADVHNPNFFLLNYDLSSYQVYNFFVIPKHFFIPEIIEKRNPLSATARRAGWIGCNILLNRIPEAGRIFLVRDGQVKPKEDVCAVWQKTLFLREEKKVESRGWILDVMRCIEAIRKKEFTLADIYKFESILSEQHPNNRHIKDKIRQQLQILRDKGYLVFLGEGRYGLA